MISLQTKIVIAQNDTSLPVTTFPWFRRMSALHESHWKSLKKNPTWRTYIEFCNFVWPHLYTVGNIFLLTKTFQKTPKSENAQKYPKNEFFCLYTTCLKANPWMIRELLSFVPADIKICSYTWLSVLATHVYFSYTQLSSYATRGCLLKMSKARLLNSG